MAEFFKIGTYRRSKKVLNNQVKKVVYDNNVEIKTYCDELFEDVKELIDEGTPSSLAGAKAVLDVISDQLQVYVNIYKPKNLN